MRTFLFFFILLLTISPAMADTTACMAENTVTVDCGPADSTRRRLGDMPIMPIALTRTDSRTSALLKAVPAPDTTSRALMEAANHHAPINIYQMPYSLTGSSPNWHRMWINTAVLSGAFISTLFVLECLPEDATAWNRASIQQTPPFKRWFRNVFKRGPEWDHDNPIFNYVLHPYAGAAYFMSARSQGFNFWQSMLYSACISTIGWEFGIEAFMERPSYQDLVVTPVIGAVFGELFYKLKRNIVSHDYRLAGSPVLGNIVVFLIDPVNEVIGLFRGNNARKLHMGRNTRTRGIESSLLPGPVGNGFGFTFTCTF